MYGCLPIYGGRNSLRSISKVPDNGQVHGEIYNYTSIVTFSCNTGYVLSNNYGLECEFNGQWNASNPTCDPVDCGNPGVPDNGQAHGDIQ